MHTETLGLASSTYAMLAGRVRAPRYGGCTRHEGGSTRWWNDRPGVDDQRVGALRRVISRGRWRSVTGKTNGATPSRVIKFQSTLRNAHDVGADMPYEARCPARHGPRLRPVPA